MIPRPAPPAFQARVPTPRVASTVAIGLAVIGAVLLASPLHLPGALLLVAGVALFCYERPAQGLWLVLVGSAIHPLVAKIVQVNLGATGGALVVFSAWKEVALGAVVLADLERIVREYLRERRLRVKLGLMDVMAVALVALVLLGLALRHDLMAVNGARLLLFPIGIYFALRFAPIETTSYFKVMAAVGAGIAAFAVVQSSILGWSFITTYWGTSTEPLPVTFMAQQVDGPRASATFGSPNELGFALIAWGLMSCALLIARPRRDRWLVLALAVVVVGLAVTFSRSAVLAMVLGLALIGMLAIRLAPNRRRALGVLALGVVPGILLSGVVYAARGGGDLIQATTDTFLYGASSATKTVGIKVQTWELGQPQTLTISVLNTHGVPDKSYRGTVHFQTSDPNASLPADYTFNSDDSGTHVFASSPGHPLEFVSVGRQWIRVTDTFDNGITGQILGTFTYPPSTSLKVDVSAWVAGTESTVTVTALDAQGSPWSGYRGTIHFTTSDPKASLPADYTFTAADQGKHTYPTYQLPPMIFGSPGDQWLRATDRVDPALSAVTAGSVIGPRTIAVHVIPSVLGGPQSVDVVVLDFKGDVDQTYRGTVRFSTSDPNATLPSDYTFTARDAGKHTFDAASPPALKIVSVGKQWVRVTDVDNGAITGNDLVDFTYPPATTLRVQVVAWVTGVPSAVTITALDAAGEPWRDYRGTIHFTSSDTKAILPADYTFTGADQGTHTYDSGNLSLVFGSTGDQWLRATDKVEPSLTAIATGKVVAASRPVPTPVRTKPPQATPQPTLTPAPTSTSAPSATATPLPSAGPPTSPPTSTATTAPAVESGYVAAADASTAAHLTSLTYGWNLLMHHPLGTGLGTVGPRPLPGTTDFPAYIIESYYLAMGVSLGWLGFVWAALLPLAMLILGIIALRRGRMVEGSALVAITVSTAVVGLVLPTMMEPQIAMIPWSVCALTATALSRAKSTEAAETESVAS